MNIGEANAFFKLMRGLESSATDADITAGLDASRALTERANQALGAGPRPGQVEALVRDLQDVIARDCGTGDTSVELGGRHVENADPVGDVL